MSDDVKNPDEKPKRKRGPGRPRKSRGPAITTKAVQAAQDRPAPALPDVVGKPEIDTDETDAGGLTVRMRKFVIELARGGVAYKAAAAAGYSDSSIKNLESTAGWLLNKPQIQRALEIELGKRYSDEDMENSLSALAHSNASDYLTKDESGEWSLDLDKMREHGALGLISGFEPEELKTVGGSKLMRFKLKTHDRIRAMELLAKLRGRIKERHEHNHRGNIGLTIDVKPALAALVSNPEAYALAKGLAARLRGDALPAPAASNGNGHASHNGSNGNGHNGN